MMSNSSEWKTLTDIVARNDLNALKDFVENRAVDLKKIRSAFGQTAAHVAAKHANLNIVQYLLEQEPFLVDIKDDWNQSVFHIAVQIGALDIVKYLNDTGKTNVNESNSFFPGSSALHIAAAVGKLNVFKFFIEELNMNANLKNDSGQPPAFSAAANNHLHVIEYLVEKTNANLTAIDNNDENILYLSARTGDLTIPKYLMDVKKMKFDVDWKNRMGETILNRASVFNNYYFVKYVVGEKHAQVNIADDNRSTPLHEAAHAGGVVLVKYLVENGANTRARDNDGKTPKEVTTDPKVLNYLESLTTPDPKRNRRNAPPKYADIFVAAEHDDLAAVKYFVEEKGTILENRNSLDETVAHIAATNGNVPILNYVLDKAPSLISAKDMQTSTPLHLATINGHLDAIKCLVDERKADLYETHYIIHGNTAAHLAAQVGNATILKYFIEGKRVNVDVKNDLGQSPLFSAASFKHSDIVRYLVEERKANITMTDVNDDNILYVMARTGDVDLVKYFMDERRAQIDVDRKDKFGETVVHRAARFGGLSVIKYLVEEKGADTNLSDKNNRTALHEAACMGYMELVKYLIERGADAEVKDKWGRTYRDLLSERDKMSTTMSVKRERRNVHTTPRIIGETMYPSLGDHDGHTSVNGDDVRSFLVLAGICFRFFNLRTVELSNHQPSDGLVLDAIYSESNFETSSGPC